MMESGVIRHGKTCHRGEKCNNKSVDLGVNGS